MVSEQEIAQAAEAMYATWMKGDKLSEAHPAIQRDYLNGVRAVLPILRPEGSVLIGGTCKNCKHWGEVRQCQREKSPVYLFLTKPDFGCVHYQRKP